MTISSDTSFVSLIQEFNQMAEAEISKIREKQEIDISDLSELSELAWKISLIQRKIPETEHKLTTGKIWTYLLLHYTNQTSATPTYSVEDLIKKSQKLITENENHLDGGNMALIRLGQYIAPALALISFIISYNTENHSNIDENLNNVLTVLLLATAIGSWLLEPTLQKKKEELLEKIASTTNQTENTEALNNLLGTLRRLNAAIDERIPQYPIIPMMG